MPRCRASDTRPRRREPVAAAIAGVIILAAMAVAPGSSALGAAPARSDGDDKCDSTVCLDAASTEATPTHLLFHTVKLVYTVRGTTVTSDLAEGDGPDARNTNWVLTGHVQIVMPQGILRADRATMQVVKGVIANMTAQGAPAEFERSAQSAAPDGGNPNLAAAAEHAHGHAREIIYDLEHNELQLNGDGFLSNGCYEFSSEHMLYDITNQKVQADPHNVEGVHGIMRDRTSSSCPGAAKS